MEENKIVVCDSCIIAWPCSSRVYDGTGGRSGCECGFWLHTSGRDDFYSLECRAGIVGGTPIMRSDVCGAGHGFSSL